MRPEFWTPEQIPGMPHVRSTHLLLYTKLRDIAKVRERKQSLGHAVGRDKVSTLSIFSQLWNADMSFRFKKMKN
jgi:hypothetical protein